MPKITARKKIDRTSIELHGYKGKNSGREYVLLKAHVRNATVFEAFAPVELKDTCLDILGLDEKSRKRHANDLARKVWQG